MAKVLDMTRIPLLATLLTLVLGGCGSTPFEYHSQNEIPQGAGVFTGDKGGVELSHGESSEPMDKQRGVMSTPAAAPAAAAPANAGQFKEFEEFQAYKRWRDSPEGRADMREFKEWQEWQRYKDWKEKSGN